MTARITVSEIKALLQAEGLTLIMELCPGGRREGAVYSCPNPTRAQDGNSSFKVWLGGPTHGAWKEFDAGEAEKGDLIDLIAYVQGTDKAAAIAWARRRLGLGRAGEDGERVRAKARDLATRRVEGEEERRRRKRERARNLFLSSSPILGAIVERHRPAVEAVRAYLVARGIDPADIPNPEFDVHAGVLEHWSSAEWSGGRRIKAGWTGPAMICAVRDRAGNISGVHCTWVRDGKKAPLPNPKLMLGDVTGGVVRLTRGPSNLAVEAAITAGVVDDVGGGEGIESSLSVGIAVPELRMWAALSIGNLGNMPFDLAVVGRGFIAAENDEKPQAVDALDRSVARLGEHGKPVAVMRFHIGKDANDTLRGK